ncbi:astacin (Peptidase family m12A) domain-containing protein [Phthorimaea operculella]|nr:astacin (Peptidase family m12A) domain-containing protein [Phthorimaea operculella]
MASREKFIFSFLIYLFLVLNKVVSNELTNQIDVDVLTTKAYVYWPNATIPFYIDGSHFDNEQAVKIMSAFATFAFKTCLKFAPVMARPEGTDHVLVLENPAGVRKCSINTEPHSIEEPHRVTLGYDCLKSPEIDMMIMKALGFPFEHNRAVRDLYIEVQPENIEPGNITFRKIRN